MSCGSGQYIIEVDDVSIVELDMSCLCMFCELFVQMLSTFCTGVVKLVVQVL